jgi:hypothetical protein
MSCFPQGSACLALEGGEECYKFGNRKSVTIWYQSDTVLLKVKECYNLVSEPRFRH